MITIGMATAIGSGLLILLALAVYALVAIFSAPAMADTASLGPIDTQLVLAAAAVTKTASFNGTALDMGSGFAPGGGGMPVQASVPVSAADFTSTDETYTFKLQHSTDNSTFTDCGAAISVVAGTVGGSILIHGTILNRYVRYALTAGGTTPSITYGPIYLVPKANR